MSDSPYPDSVDFESVASAFSSLGINLADVREVHLKPGLIEVVKLSRTSDGHLLPGPDNKAVVHTFGVKVNQ